MIVVNISGKPLPIPEIHKIIPSDGKQYILHEQLARKYKEFLKPIQMSDSPPPAPVVINRQYKATVIEIDLDSIIAEEIEPKMLDENVFNEIKKSDEPVVKPLSGKKIAKNIKSKISSTKKSKKD